MALITVARSMDVGTSSAPALANFFVLTVISEIISFVQEKAQVQLFLSSKVIKLQELQLLDMLDSVPDKVLVCSNEKDFDS